MESETFAKFGPKYRVAVCFTGPRALKLCFPKLKTHFFDQWNIEPTYFYHGPAHKDYAITDVIPNVICKIEEDSPTTVKQLKDCPVNVSVLNWQWYNIKKCFELAFNYKHDFDFFMRVRTDIYPVGKSQLRWDYRNLRPDMLYVPMKLDYELICDRFAFGTREIMEVYSGLYDSNTFTETTFNSENRLLTHLKNHKIKICYLLENFDLDFCHKDDNGVIRYEGPEVQEKLVHLDGESNHQFDNLWWPKPSQILTAPGGPRYKQ
ncbi:MAG: hypothetical protein EBU90_03380 [Proteobacteria bacterium]|nr:hypothetical protein [Pseudomonadota bacterium]NBP13369.1 hypothetical protein [bacterium]